MVESLKEGWGPLPEREHPKRKDSEFGCATARNYSV